MKTLSQLLSEVDHFIDRYGKWGIITHKGIVPGGPHPTADEHNVLAHEEGHKVGSGTYAEYYQHSGYNNHEPHLAIRTYGKESAAMAHKFFDHLPHVKRGDVVHEHFKKDASGDYSVLEGNGRSGKRYQIKHHLAVLGGL